MENTLENKSKFFAQYINQIVFNNGNYSPRPLGYIHLDNNSLFLRNGWIELKHISSISNYDLDRIKFMQFPVQPFLKELDSTLIMADTSDYLRSKGYALQYNGLSVEDLLYYKWIKLI